MDLTSILIANDTEFVSAAPDHSTSLLTLLAEEDQHQYNQLLLTPLPHQLRLTLHHISSLLHLSSSAVWMATVLLQRLTVDPHPIDLLTIVASLTLSAKYQHASTLPTVDYDLVAQHCHIDDVHLIHDAEMDVLDRLSFDVCVTTPDHFFSLLSSRAHGDADAREIIARARSALSGDGLSPELSALLHSYPSSIVALSLTYSMSPSSFIVDQIKSFVRHKKDATPYFTQLLQCIAQLQSASSSIC